ncbi:albusnodin family lasso peptide [Streptomyces netropsis]
MAYQDNEQMAPMSAAELPEVIDLGDAAALTKGNTSSSVESKQTPYS